MTRFAIVIPLLFLSAISLADEPEYLSYSANVDPGRREGKPGDVKDPVGEKYPFGRVSELYTNQVAPYYRAPHLLPGFPTRYIDRGWTESVKSLPRYDCRQARAKDSRPEGTAVTDGMFMSSRDRQHFSVWPESFVRPGLRTRDSWFYGDASTSAAGAVRVEIQDSDGQPLPGFALAGCQEVYGDDLERTVIRAGNPDLGAFAGRPVRLRFEVKDADLYSFRFRAGSR